MFLKKEKQVSIFKSLFQIGDSCQLQSVPRCKGHCNLGQYLSLQLCPYLHFWNNKPLVYSILYKNSKMHANLAILGNMLYLRMVSKLMSFYYFYKDLELLNSFTALFLKTFCLKQTSDQISISKMQVHTNYPVDIDSVQLQKEDLSHLCELRHQSQEFPSSLSWDLSQSQSQGSATYLHELGNLGNILGLNVKQ